MLILIPKNISTRKDYKILKSENWRNHFLNYCFQSGFLLLNIEGIVKMECLAVRSANFFPPFDRLETNYPTCGLRLTRPTPWGDYVSETRPNSQKRKELMGSFPLRKLSEKNMKESGTVWTAGLTKPSHKGGPCWSRTGNFLSPLILKWKALL